MKKYIVFILAVTAFFSGFSQSVHVFSGIVRDAEKQMGVPYTQLLINRVVVDAAADGTFSVQLPKASSYTVEASQLGYASFQQTYTSWPSEGLEIQLTPRPVWISEILVSGQQRPAIAQSAVLADNLDQAEQPRDIGDLLRSLPGFSIIKRGGYALDPVFRGFKYEQLNVVYDGGMELTHACPNRMDPTTTHINPQDIQKIELIRGPFSMRYGPALGATIHLVTENPFAQGMTGLGGSVDAGYSTNGSGKTGRVALWQQSENAYFAAAGGIKDYGDYRSGDGTVIPSSFHSWDYDLKAGTKLGASQQLMATWRQGFAKDVVHVGLMMDTDYDNSSIASLDYKWSNAGGLLHELNAKAYYSFVDHQMSNTNRPSFKSSGAVANVTATTMGGRVEATLLRNARERWFIGTDVRYTGRSGSRVRTQKVNMATGEPLAKPLIFNDTIWPDASVTDAGLFLEGRKLLGEKWTLLTGIRTDVVWAAASLAEADFRNLYGSDLSPTPDFLLSGTASIAWQPGTRTNVQLAVGRGVRPANMIERYINHFNVGRDPYEYVGNPFLKAEANHQAELSWKYTAPSWEAGAQVFYSYIDNYISAVVDSSLKRKFMPMSQPRVSRRFVNLEAAIQTGFEAQVGVDLWKNLRFSSTIAYTYAENKANGTPLPEIAPFESTQSLRYRPQGWWVEVKNRVVGAQNRVSAAFGEPVTQGFQTLDLQGGAELFAGFQINGGVSNLFDVNYREHLNRAYTNWPEQGFILEPGRNVHLSVKYSF